MSGPDRRADPLCSMCKLRFLKQHRHSLTQFFKSVLLTMNFLFFCKDSTRNKRGPLPKRREQARPASACGTHPENLSTRLVQTSFRWVRLVQTSFLFVSSSSFLPGTFPPELPRRPGQLSSRGRGLCLRVFVSSCLRVFVSSCLPVFLSSSSRRGVGPGERARAVFLLTLG